MSTANKCSDCGAIEIGVTGEFDESILFECGSEGCPDEPELNLQSDTCRELCELRRWKQVVLDSIRLDFDYDTDTLAYVVNFASILPCNIDWPDEIPTLEEVKMAFDEAVKNKA